MNALDPAREFAASAGCNTDNPHLLAMYAEIRRHGIREARAMHFQRRLAVDEMKAHPGMFFAMIHPNLSTEEAIEDFTRIIFRFRNLPRHQQAGSRLAMLGHAKAGRVYARFFRRFGQRVWARRAA